MLVEAMAATFKKRNKGCFNCGDENHLKRDCPRRLIKYQKFALAAIEECTGPKVVNLNLMLMESLFRETPNRDHPPGPLQRKPGANSIFSLKPSTSGSAAVDIPALNDFFLYPQAVPTRVPTRLFRPLPPQTFSWLI